MAREGMGAAFSLRYISWQPVASRGQLSHAFLSTQHDHNATLHLPLHLRSTAEQWGEADVDGKDFSGQDLRRSNFTAASARKTIFKDANLQGAYFIKTVAFKANFEVQI
jgi:uncharacterized protein YjbI with pentapeptide repeats